MAAENASHRFERLAPTPGECEVAGRPSRAEVLDYWEERFGVEREVFDDFSFWEKGAGKLWVTACDVPDGLAVESLGLTFLRTRQEHWKPTTNAVQRFGRHASRNVIELPQAAAKRFLAGEDQPVEWDGDWGYLICAHELAGAVEPVGVGLYLHGELRSMVPKGSRRDL